MQVQCDASQLEWRMALLLSRDEVGIEELKQGQDVHGLNQVAFVLPERLIAKRFLFRTIFRGSGWAFANDNDFKHVSNDPDFWDEKNKLFYKKYKGLDQCHTQWAQLVASRTPIRGPTGREWMIKLNDDGSIPWTVLSNYPVQGTSADLMSVARVSLKRRVNSSGLKCSVVSTVHDSIVVDSPKENVDKVAGMMYSVFDDLPKNMKKLWGIDSPIAFPCEVKVGLSLGEMEKYGRPTQH